MKKLISLSILISFFQFLISQSYSFQDIRLNEEVRIDSLISILTLEEKIDLFSTRPSIPRLGIKGTRIVEGLHGLALSGPANWAVKGAGESATTIFPQAIGLAQTWDPELIKKVAQQEAYECRYLTQNSKYSSAGLIVLAPNADLGRDIRWGRNEECYGEDPYLTASFVIAFVRGLQGDHPRYWTTASLMKHFLANSNENERNINSSDFDEQLFREYYSYPFYKGITVGGSRAYMTAYNKYNGIPCIVHPVNKKVAISEWGQDGIIATDGGAFRLLVSAHRYYNDLPTAAAACIKAGINMFLDNYREPLKEALEKDLITEEDINIAIKGTLRVLLKLGLLDNSDENPYARIGITDTIEPWTKPEVHSLVREVTRKSIVLLKNDNQILPLHKGKIKSIAVIGPRANEVLPDWYSGKPPYSVTILQGIRNIVGNDIKINYALSNKADSAIIAAKESDVAIVCIGNHPLCHNQPWGKNIIPSEGREAIDRQAITTEQEDLVRLVYKANPNTILILVTNFPYAINWSKKNIPAILYTTHSSQELGNAVADILFGIENPAGRLVQTWHKSIDELPPMLNYNIREGRTYLFFQNEPLFPFGYGLSYTSFKYHNLKIDKNELKEGDTLNLYFKITNIGNYHGEEVVQLYVQFPNSKVQRPIKSLKGFKKIYIPKGQTIEVRVCLLVNELKYWNNDQGKWQLEMGRVNFFIGGNSNDRRLNGKVKIVE